METKNVSLKKRIAKAHSKANFAGFLYNFGSIVLLAILFLPLITVAQSGGGWELSALTFFQPLTSLDFGLNYATLKNLPVAIVFFVMILVAFINMIKCFVQGKELNKKNPTKLNGYNRPYFAMVAMGKTYSFTLWTIIVGYLGIYLTEATVNGLFVAIALGVALLIHFWAALVGADINMYDVTDDTIVEEKRVGGVGKHFLCNLIQVIGAAAIVYFYAVGTTVKELMRLLIEKDGVNKLLELGNLIPLLAQVLLLIFLVFLVKKATGINEYLHDGIYTPGIRGYAVLGWFVAIIAAAWVVVELVIGSGALNTAAVLIAAVGIITALLDAATKPTAKALKQAEKQEIEKAAKEAAEIKAVPAQNTAKLGAYRVSLGTVSQPGVFMQPNGQPLMVMPMVAGAQTAPMYQQPTQAPVANGMPGYSYAYGNPYGEPAPTNDPYAPAYWDKGAPHGFAAQEPAEDKKENEQPEGTEEPKVDKKDAANQKKLAKQAAKKEKAEKKKAAADAKKAAAAAKKAEKQAKKDAKKKPAVEVVPTAAEPATEQPAPAPAPANLQPAPSPMVIATGIDGEEDKDKIVVPAGLPEGLPPNAAPVVTEEILPPPTEEQPEVKDEDRKKHDVVCPDCGKKLSVKEGALAYRCPECGSVFQLQKTKQSA